MEGVFDDKIKKRLYNDTIYSVTELFDKMRSTHEDYRVFGQKPIPNNITPKELSSVLLRHGFKIKPGKGSHYIIERVFPDGNSWHYVIPLGGRKVVLPCYIRAIRKAMLEHDMEVYFA